jgi:hypothetical protein
VENLLKQFIGKASLLFLGRFLDLKKAYVATFGGEGWEAKAWEGQGIAGTQGSLIERKGKLSKILIRDTPYHIHNDLKTYPEIFQNLPGQNGLDLFHWDLASTAELKQHELCIMLPLVLGSRGRCLAITVPDCRWNWSVDNWQKVRWTGEGLLGKIGVKDLAEMLLNQQQTLPRNLNGDLPAFFKNADPIKGVRREFGLFTLLCQLLAFKTDQPLAGVDRMTRYIYVSRYSGTPFRMRTYFFHLTKASAKPATDFAAVWQNSPLFFLKEDEGGVREITIQFRKSRRKKEDNMPKGQHAQTPPVTVPVVSKLGQLAEISGGDILREYKELTKAAGDIETLRTRIRSLIDGPQNGTAARVASSAPTAPAPAVPDAEPSKPHGRHKTLSSLKPDVKMDLKAHMVIVKGEGPEAYSKLLEELMATYGPESRRALGGMLANTQTSFRPAFIRDVLKHHDSAEGMLASLANAYTKIDRRPVTVDQLKREAATSKDLRHKAKKK